MVQATNNTATKETARHGVSDLGDALRDVVLAARRRSAGSAQDASVVALLMHLIAVGPLRAGDLAEHACLDPSTVSRHLRSLEADGHLERVPDPDDGRATLLLVTDSGRLLVTEVRRQRLAMLSEAVVDWSQNDVATLTRLTRRLAESLELS